MAKRKRDSEWDDPRRELAKQVKHPYITKQGLDRNRRGGKGRDSKRRPSEAVSLLVAGHPAFYITTLKT